jgi:hypothetical protein
LDQDEGTYPISGLCLEADSIVPSSGNLILPVFVSKLFLIIPIPQPTAVAGEAWLVSGTDGDQHGGTEGDRDPGTPFAREPAHHYSRMPPGYEQRMLARFHGCPDPLNASYSSSQP